MTYCNRIASCFLNFFIFSYLIFFASALQANQGFVGSLKGALINGRAGPSYEYPIIWVYHRNKMPVKILKSYDSWYFVQDWEGQKVWVQSSLVSLKKAALVVVDRLTVYRRPGGKAIFYASYGTTADFEGCEGDWCFIRFSLARSGWAAKKGLWYGEAP